MGSAVHAASLAREKARVRLMISLEMIGYFSDAPGSQQFPAPGLSLLYPTTGNFIAVVGKLGQGAVTGAVKRAMGAATELPVESINAPRSLPGVDLSDHRSYWEHGWNAVMVTDTAFFRTRTTTLRPTRPRRSTTRAWRTSWWACSRRCTPSRVKGDRGALLREGSDPAPASQPRRARGDALALRLERVRLRAGPVGGG